jgi:hypothetical protein
LGLTTRGTNSNIIGLDSTINPRRTPSDDALGDAAGHKYNPPLKKCDTTVIDMEG